MTRSHVGHYLQAVPIILFPAVAMLLLHSPEAKVFEPPLLLPILNTVFLAALPFFIAVVAARIYVDYGRPEFLLLGCGMAAFGLGSLGAGWGLPLYGQNFMVTVHNAGSLLGGLCHLGAVAVLVVDRPARAPLSRRAALVVVMTSYSISACSVLAVAFLTAYGVFPVFFIQGSGPTTIRQVVLIFAVLAYALGAIVMVDFHERTQELLFRLYASALFLMAVGLGIFMAQKSVGSALSWMGRGAQYAASVYFLAAAALGWRRGRSLGSSLPAYLQEILSSRIDDAVHARTRDLLELNEKLRVEVEERKKAEDALRLSEQNLRDREVTYRTFVDDTLQGFSVIQDGRVVLCNGALATMSGYSVQELQAMSPQETLATVHPDDRPQASRLMQEIMEDSLPRPAQVVRMVKKTGDTDWVEILGARTSYKGRPALQLSYVSRTAEIRANEAYRSLIDSAPYGMVILREGRIIFCNGALAELTGQALPELLTMPSERLLSLVAEKDAPSVVSYMTELLNGGVVPPRLDFRLNHKDGIERWIEARPARMSQDQSEVIHFIIKDVTAEKAAQDLLTSAHQQMRNLASHLLRAREEERRAVAREIHDELGQTLAALNMDLHWLAKRLAGSEQTFRDRVKGTIELGEQAIRTVQRIASDLRPKMLDDLGLLPALNWLCADFSRRTKISCRLEGGLAPGKAGGNSAIVLYRVAQEALSNVRLHSHADHAVVRLYESEGAVVLQVEDDGVGITDEQSTAPDSYGLIGMRERVESLAGSLAITGETGFGTILIARISLPQVGGLP
jgi:hypothetical protein